jgi:hypothetical protein
MGNLDLARQGAQVMDTLAQYDHLPALGNVMLCQRHTGFAVKVLFYAGYPEAHHAVAVWADTFSAPVTLLRSQAGGRIKTNVDTGSFVFEFDEPAHNFQVLAYASRLGLKSVWEKRLSVAAFLLRGAVEAEMAAVA